MTLSECRAGTHGTVVSFSGGGRLQERLTQMGIYPGRDVRVIHPSSRSGGPALLALGHTRLAVGRGMLEKIIIAVDQEN